jgi:hypothetical protein
VVRWRVMLGGRSITERIGSSRPTVAVTMPVRAAAVTVTGATATARAAPIAVAVAGSIPVCPWRWWWIGRAPTAGPGVVGQRPFGRLPCAWPMVSTSERLRRFGLCCVGGFGREFSRMCTG